MNTAEPLARRLEAPRVYDLDESLRFLAMGAYDPTCRRTPGAFWKAGHTPDGPVTLELRREPDAVAARGHGPGAAWALARARALAGLEDAPAAFVPPAGRLATLARRGRGLHLPRTPFVFDALTGVVLQQRIAWRDATRAYRQLTSAFGEPAPRPHGLTLPIAPRAWLQIPDASLRRAGVDGQRARALRAGSVQAGSDCAPRLPAHPAAARKMPLSRVASLRPSCVSAIAATSSPTGFAAGAANGYREDHPHACRREPTASARLRARSAVQSRLAHPSRAPRRPPPGRASVVAPTPYNQAGPSWHSPPAHVSAPTKSPLRSASAARLRSRH